MHAFLRAQDRMSLLEFATDVHELTPFTNKPAGSIVAWTSCAARATALYDAIYLGSERLGAQEGRKVLVLVSDGGDTAKSTTYAEALEAGAAQRGHDLLHHRRAHRGQRRPRHWAASMR